MMDDGEATTAKVSGLANLLIGAASVSALIYALLLKLSWKFTTDTIAEDRPTIAMLALFGSLFVVYWIALWIALRMRSSRMLLGGIVAAACLFRGILLPSIPMHEIDIYRYIWDGAVFAEGISPYRYSPQQVLDAVDAGGVDDDATLQRLVELQARSGSLNQSLNTIHYGQYPSPYPIVSQAAFAVAAKVTPNAASSHTRLMIMKAVLVVFDIATLIVVALLLREVGKHVGWSLVYGWCPLLMKEIANGGHLDSIAIFFTTLAVLAVVKYAKRQSNSVTGVALAGGVLALAIGAKLYPVVLVPLFTAVWFRQLGWKAAFAGVTVTGLLSVLLLYPLFGPSEPQVASAVPETPQSVPLAEGQLSEPPASPASQVEADDGIEAFLNMWEMNDLLFMIVLENLRDQQEVEAAKQPWFVFTSGEWSRSLVTRYALFRQSLFGDSDEGPVTAPLTPFQLRRASFSLARLITGGLFAVYACVLAWFAAGKKDVRIWCRAAMLTLAWFWMTCPTQNPWYWCWVLPLLPFARYRAWHVVAAMTMLYYLRFWLMTHYSGAAVMGTPYDGAYFFYFVIAWVEFLPILVALVIESILSRLKTDRGGDG